MDKPSWRVLMKETWRVTWPIQICQIVIICLLFINIAIYYLLFYHEQEQFGCFITLNGIFIGLGFVIRGYDYIHYKEHYNQMAVKYSLPEYHRMTKHAIWWFVAGASIIIISIAEWLAFS